MPILIHVDTLSHTYATKIMGQNMYSSKTHFCLKPAYHQICNGQILLYCLLIAKNICNNAQSKQLQYTTHSELIFYCLMVI